MAYLNKVMIIGNVGSDISVRTGNNNMKFCSLNVATSRRYRDNNGELKEQTEWHKVSAFGKTVDLLQQLSVGKGTSIYVEGSLRNRSYDDSAGIKRTITEIAMENFQLLGTKPNSSAQSGNAYNPYSRANQQNQQQQGSQEQPNPFGGYEGSGEPEDGLPF